MHRAGWWWFNSSLCTDPGSNQLISWRGGVLLPLQYFSHLSFWRTDIIVPSTTQYAPRLGGKCRMRKTLLQESLQQGCSDESAWLTLTEIFPIHRISWGTWSRCCLLRSALPSWWGCHIT